MHCPELWIVVNVGGSSSAQDTDSAGHDASDANKQNKPARGRKKLSIGAVPASPAPAKPKGRTSTAAADTTEELQPLADTSPEAQQETKTVMKYNTEGFLVSVKDGRALASQLQLKKRFPNNYRNPDNKERCDA